MAWRKKIGIPRLLQRDRQPNPDPNSRSTQPYVGLKVKIRSSQERTATQKAEMEM